MTPLVNTAIRRLKELAQNKTQTVFRVCSCSDALIQPSSEAQLGAASECCDASLINLYFACSHREEKVCLLSSVSGWKLVDAFVLFILGLPSNDGTHLIDQSRYAFVSSPSHVRRGLRDGRACEDLSLKHHTLWLMTYPKPATEESLVE